MRYDLSYCTRPDGATIAYTAVGDGPPLILAPGWTTHLEFMFQGAFTEILGPLAEHYRLIVYDKHGCGLSDRDRTEFTLETERLDLEALADHLELDRFNLWGMSEGGPVAISYAAQHPEQVEKLVLYSTFSHGDALAPEDFRKSFVGIVRSSWGVGSKVIADMLIPGADQETMEEFARWQRDSASKEVAAATLEMLYDFDVRDVLKDVQAPTVIIMRRESRAFPPRHARELAAGIPDAHVVLVPGRTHAPMPGDPHTRTVVNEILGFLSDGTVAASPYAESKIRTIVFTDVEASTALTERLGDAAVREILREHERLTREALAQHGGREIKTMGDGFMASFNSASGALDAAIAMQHAIAEHFAGTETPIRIRVGINAGEPIEEEDDLYGTAVIQAARVMGQADGGQILVTETVRSLVAGKDYAFANHGETTLKGFPEPVRLFTVAGSG